jgi:hypothetical protein
LFNALTQAPWPVRVAAAREILDHHLGEPRQAIEMSGPDNGPVQLIASTTSAEQAADLYARTLRPNGPALIELEREPIERTTNGRS